MWFVVFATLTVIWAIFIGTISNVFSAKTSIHEIQVILIGLGFWVWLATVYIADRLRDERQKITDILEEIKEIQETDSQRKAMILSARRKKHQP